MVNVEHGLPVVLAVDAGVVDHNVDRAERINAEIEHVLEVVGRRNVDASKGNIVGAELGGELIGRLLAFLNIANLKMRVLALLLTLGRLQITFQRMSATMHFAPRLSSASTVDLPMPRAPPVTIQHLPSKFILDDKSREEYTFGIKRISQTRGSKASSGGPESYGQFFRFLLARSVDVRRSRIGII